MFTGLSLQQTRNQNGIAEQGQITDRYSTAISELGSTTLDVRLGGIYALERIMRDSPPDQPTIVAVLSAFVRDHPPGSTTVLPEQILEKPPMVLADYIPYPGPPTDVGAALTVLGRRDRNRDQGAFEDLNGVNFELVNLSEAHLAGADLHNADLGGAILAGADLSGADLDGAFLGGVDLIGANLTGTFFVGTLLCDGKVPTNPDLRYACQWVLPGICVYVCTPRRWPTRECAGMSQQTAKKPGSWRTASGATYWAFEHVMS